MLQATLEAPNAGTPQYIGDLIYHVPIHAPHSGMRRQVQSKNNQSTTNGSFLIPIGDSPLTHPKPKPPQDTPSERRTREPRTVTSSYPTPPPAKPPSSSRQRSMPLVFRLWTHARQCRGHGGLHHLVCVWDGRVGVSGNSCCD